MRFKIPIPSKTDLPLINLLYFSQQGEKKNNVSRQSENSKSANSNLNGLKHVQLAQSQVVAAKHAKAAAKKISTTRKVPLKHKDTPLKHKGK